MNTADILVLAGKMYGRHLLSSVDDHTLQCPVEQITYVPIPSGALINHTSLITVDLPPNVRKGQLFRIVVQQITNTSGIAAPREELVPDNAVAEANPISEDRLIRWRTVLGSFQISIPVSTKDVMLAPEEQLLSIFKYIQLSIPSTDRWYLVFSRYVTQIGQRVQGLGGNPGQILPSPIGVGQPPETHISFVGKVVSLIFDRFGDFEGFELDTLKGNRRFSSQEKDMAMLVDQA